MGEGALTTVPGAFPSTHWSLIYLASLPEQQAGEGALHDLLGRYYEPLLSHVRRRFGFDEPTARDVLQGFVERKVLVRRLLVSADQPRGRFRTFLLNALDNHAIDELRSRNCLTRRPPGGFAALEDAEAAKASTPPEAGVWFDREWARAVMQEAEQQTRAFYEDKGRHATWAVFEQAVLRPLKGQAARPSDEELAKRYGFASARQVSNALTTARRQYGAQLRAIVRQYVESDADVDEELRELVAILAEGGRA